MKKILLLVLLLHTGILAAQDDGGFVIPIWDNASAPHSNGITTPEEWLDAGHVGNVSHAEMILFPAEPAKATGEAILICPGGGYRYLSVTKEGTHMAQWFAANGITAAVLRYRMPNGQREVPLEDAVQALRILKGLEKGLGPFSYARVGIAGCSAGGHLAAMVSTLGTTRPDFTVLFYPVITGERDRCHEGSFDALLGEKRSKRLTARYSLERQVDETTPPALLLLSDNDHVVPPISSTRYYNALKEHGIEASMHIYPAGGHGWGMREDFPYKEQWREAVLEWLKKIRE